MAALTAAPTGTGCPPCSENITLTPACACRRAATRVTRSYLWIVSHQGIACFTQPLSVLVVLSFQGWIDRRVFNES